MNQSAYSKAVATARAFYNDRDADLFYAQIWGGDDIHVGLYADDAEPIAEASRRTVAHMAAKLDDALRPGAHVIDFGGGYGGAARFLAQVYGVAVVSLNLSEVENERARRLNAEAGLQSQIEIIDGDFEHAPFPDASFDVVWSQEAFLHSGNKARVLREVARLLKPGGQLIFTDPMRSDDCSEEALQAVRDRLQLSDLASPGFYQAQLTSLGFEQPDFEDQSAQLTRHYGRVKSDLQGRYEELTGQISPAFMDRMIAGLEHWVTAGQAGQLCWGIMRARRSA